MAPVVNVIKLFFLINDDQEKMRLSLSSIAKFNILHGRQEPKQVEQNRVTPLCRHAANHSRNIRLGRKST